MSIPERFARIARHKFNEIKDRIDQWDEEAEEREAAKSRRASDKSDAQRELDDALSEPRVFPAKPSESASTQAPSSRPRTPEEIARGARPTTSPRNAPLPSTPISPSPNGTASDPLEYHYRLLGLEPGADFPAVEAAYNKYAARCEVSRFSAGSPEAQQAEQIRQKLENSFRILRDALDMTARRFDLLEFDESIPTNAPSTPPAGAPDV